MNRLMKKYIGKVRKVPKHRNFCPCETEVLHPPGMWAHSPTRELFSSL